MILVQEWKEANLVAKDGFQFSMPDCMLKGNLIAI